MRAVTRDLPEATYVWFRKVEIMNSIRHSKSLKKSVTALMTGLVITGAALPQVALADGDELDRTKLVRLLGERYGESSVSAGIAQNGSVVELLTNADGSTWTLLMTLPDGSTQVIATGESWISTASLPGDPI